MEGTTCEFASVEAAERLLVEIQSNSHRPPAAGYREAVRTLLGELRTEYQHIAHRIKSGCTKEPSVVHDGVLPVRRAVRGSSFLPSPSREVVLLSKSVLLRMRLSVHQEGYGLRGHAYGLGGRQLQAVDLVAVVEGKDRERFSASVSGEAGFTLEALLPGQYRPVLVLAGEVLVFESFRT